MTTSKKIQFYDLVQRKKVSAQVKQIKSKLNPKTGRRVFLAFGTGKKGNQLSTIITSKQATNLRKSIPKKRTSSVRRRK